MFYKIKTQKNNNNQLGSTILYGKMMKYSLKLAMLLNGCCKNNWLTQKSAVKSDKKSHIKSYIKALILSYRKQCCHGQKLLLLIIGMMVMPAYGLSTESLRTIGGSGPYLIFDDGMTNLKLKNWDDLFFLGYYEKDKLVYYPLDNQNNGNRYELPLNFSGLTFADLWSIVPPKAPTLLDNDGERYQKISIAELLQLPYYTWQDDDGDTGISGRGEIALKIEKKTIYNDNYYLERTEKIDPCDYVYSLGFSLSRAALATQYGDPRENDYGNRMVHYNLYPSVSAPYLCYGVRVPSASQYRQEDGVSGEWQSDKGMFFIQSYDSSLGNVPTMGYSGASFDLFVATGRERNFSYTKQPIDSPLSLTLFGSFSNTSALTVMIDGPSDYSYKEETMSFKPTTFTIYAGEMQTKPIYQFTIKKWIIAAYEGLNSDNNVDYHSMLYHCFESFGYTLPRIAELTNAKMLSQDPKDYLLNDGYTAKRQIGGGFVAEWGDFSKIASQPPRFFPEEAFSEEGYLITLHDGRISGSKRQTRGLFCISPDQ